MKITGNTLSLYVDIPISEISIFKYLAHKMGWKVHVAKENEETLSQEEEKNYFSKTPNVLWRSAWINIYQNENTPTRYYRS